MSKAPRRKVYVFYASNHPDPLEVTKAIINGLDISLVDPQLYKDIVPHVKMYSQRFSDRGDHSGVQKMNFILDYIAKYPDRDRISKSLIIQEHPKPKKEPPFQGEQLENEIDEVVGGNIKVYTPDERQCVLEGLKNRKQMLIEDEKYVEADQCSKAIELFIADSEFSNANQLANERVSELNIKLEEAQSQLKDLKRRWTQVEKNFQIASKKELDDYESELKAEIDECAKQSEQPPGPQFTKYSPQYHALKRKEQSMVNSHRYIEAEAVKDEALAVKKSEDKKHQQEWNAFCEFRLEKCKARCSEKYKIRKAKLNRDYQTLLIHKRNEIESAEKNVAHISQLIEKSQNIISLMESTQTRTSLPVLQLKKIQPKDDANPLSPAMFSQRRLLNYRLYSRRAPPKSAR